MLQHSLLIITTINLHHKPHRKPNSNYHQTHQFCIFHHETIVLHKTTKPSRACPGLKLLLHLLVVLPSIQAQLARFSRCHMLPSIPNSLRAPSRPINPEPVLVAAMNSTPLQVIAAPPSSLSPFNPSPAAVLDHAFSHSI
ncbi:hypothetical protein M0R45_030284 [Rubus argutus]|uniref:Uncharacterized protein n=1 Tax=Rubus argutus TaxID=59490 RepID=A0AAW1WB19_RUBAR